MPVVYGIIPFNLATKIHIKIFIMIHSKKNESCVTQDKTVYQAKAKFILVRIEQFEINTVYCVELFWKVNENRLQNHHGGTFNNSIIND